MAFRTSTGAPLRLAYCTNVAPAPSVDALVGELRGTWSAVREASGTPGRLGLGLWFPRDVARELAGSRARVDEVRAALDASGLLLETVNAFPADAFHADVVKEAVYQPDWTDVARTDYTRDVAAVAAALTSPGGDVTLSTLPLAYPRDDRRHALRAFSRVEAAALELLRLRMETGVTVRLALEPEPCCALERTSDLVEHFVAARTAKTRGAGGAALAAIEGVSEDEVYDLIDRHLGACLDLCHLAVAHEDPLESLRTCRQAGIPVHKVQVSAALEVPDPADGDQRARLEAFVEQRWLHQVGAPGRATVPDLPEALADGDLATAAPWRVHFHVPLHRDEVGGLPTTRPLVERFLAAMAVDDAPPVLELETYTWSVVPGADEDLVANVAAEIRWAREVLLAAGAVEEETEES